MWENGGAMSDTNAIPAQNDEIPTEERAPVTTSQEVVDPAIPTEDKRAEGGSTTPSWRAAKGKWVTGREADNSQVVRGGSDPARKAAGHQAIGILTGATIYETLIKNDTGQLAIDTSLRVNVKTAFGEEQFRFPFRNCTSASIAINSLRELKKGDCVSCSLRTHVNGAGRSITYPGFAHYPQGFLGEPVRITPENKGKGVDQDRAREILFEDAKTFKKDCALWVAQEASVKAVADAAKLCGWDDDIEARGADYATVFAATYKNDNVLDLTNGVHCYRLCRLISGWKGGTPGVTKRVTPPIGSASGHDDDDDDPFADE